MKIQKLGLATLAFTFLGIASSAWATPAQVLIIRHGEKPATGNDLSPQGYQRAQAYVNYFQTNPAVLDYGTPVAIYAMKPADPNDPDYSDNSDTEDSSNRPIETVTPLAQALGLELHDQYTRKQIPALVNDIMSNPDYDGRMVLICWEHKVINDIAAQFGVNPEPDKWSDDVYDQVWEINFSGDQVSNFKEFSEHLMPWDN